MNASLPRELPAGLTALADLALDLRWTWSHGGDALWRALDPKTWSVTKNPWVILQNVSEQRLAQAAGDASFCRELERLSGERQHYLATAGCFRDVHADTGLRAVGYFSMEFGLGQALPLYAGGLGVLAGDYLKAASDQGVPLVGVGLLYQEGYFRQMVDGEGRQLAVYPYNDPSMLPIQPVQSPEGGRLRLTLDFPGRQLKLRVWRANVGRVTLYLLDSNDPLNAPADRGITGKLYGGGPEVRLMQEIVLGIGGWRLLETLGIAPGVCHLNEGHAAFAILERARSAMGTSGMSFWEALWTTRAGNVFTTHTPVAAGFDSFSAALIEKYLPYFRIYLAEIGVTLGDVLALGRKDPGDASEPFNMAYLAMRGSGWVNGVSQLHGEVSRRIFAGLYPQRPLHEVPVGHVTNGVHVPSWDSAWADTLWSEACGPERWRGANEALGRAIQALDDEAIWSFALREREDLVRYARARLTRQLNQRGADPQVVAQAAEALDPNVLTLGFARRFAEYKRPNLLLHDPARLKQILNQPGRPIQLIIAGKAHPDDDTGKRLVREWVEFAGQADVRRRAVFLEDYDISLAQEMVQGVDVWINTPRRPWEACGTSGMKVLVNGGLNLSSLDGWWAEAYSPDVGWALGDGGEHDGADWDAREAQALYRLLEEVVVPLFYRRDAQGIPREWVARMRASMARLAPRFSANRMAWDYVDGYYLPAAAAFRQRGADNGRLARELCAWQEKLRRFWPTLHFGNLQAERADGSWQFAVQVYLGELSCEDVRVELFAEGSADSRAVCQPMEKGEAIAGAANGYIFRTRLASERPWQHFTPRIVPEHAGAIVPLECNLIRWQR
jgi:starch phosphorylase